MLKESPEIMRKEKITEFYFVRHGETVANKSGILQGSLNSPLNENGRAQAAAVAAALKEFSFDLILSSPLDRAAETARTIAACGHTDVPLRFTEALQEWKCGDVEGSSWRTVAAEHPEYLAAFHREAGEIRFPGGESRSEFQARVDRLLAECAAGFPGGRILLVSHGGVLQRIFRRIAGIVAPENLIPLAGNGSLSTFSYDAGQKAWQLTSWNCREHLKDLPEHLTLAL